MCTDVRWLGDANLVEGRVYNVGGVLDDGAGLILSDLPTPAGYRGYASRRFHRIPKGMTYAASVGGLV